ncbi:hypothetical protein GCM10009558_030650 [Virgisporangium aurantiacum]
MASSRRVTCTRRPASASFCRASASSIPIRSSGTFTVSGSGNYTCVYHGRYQGDAISTCYAHQSQILVHPGQQVRRGQLIGRVGSTGTSTGPHLHFEVRLDGNPVDPARWLPSCLC